MSGHWSGGLADTIQSLGKLMMRSGCPISQLSESSNWRAGGMSAGFPCGAPASTHLVIVAISSSVNDTSLLKLWTPTFLSMNQGGISREATFALIAFAYGRVSS